ncbi:MAG: hypothetical protein HN796_26245 [Gemmatimonadetes bacterium]|nr:hypothetical protein [Gemmatimonadota bacterium]
MGVHGEIHASDLIGWTVDWELPTLGFRQSMLWVDPGESGKLRLRAYERNWPQIGRQVASLLLMPDPVRDRAAPSAGAAILIRKEYHLTKVGFRTDSVLNASVESVLVRPAYVEVANAAGSEVLGFSSRLERVLAVHEHAAALPPALREAVEDHSDAVHSGEAIGRAAVASAERVLVALEGVHGYMSGHDALPFLERMLGLSEIEEGAGLPDVGEIDPDEIEARVRSASDLRMARTRGHSAHVFSRLVRTAYDHRCVMCGLRLAKPGVPGIRSGVDAAHILAWSDYDLDVVPNGLTLCKNHHWAFDQMVLTVRREDDLFLIEESPRLSLFDLSTQAYLQEAVGVVPLDRLPTDRSDWPAPSYLDRLYADIDLSLSV